ncbi:uncharacterized protein LOC144632733 [Oculina patagonica]
MASLNFLHSVPVPSQPTCWERLALLPLLTIYHRFRKKSSSGSSNMLRFRQLAPQADWEQTAAPPQPRPSGGSLSFSPVASHRTLHTLCLPSWNSQVFYLLLLQTMGSIPCI